jgi:hypothetical protein
MRNVDEEDEDDTPDVRPDDPEELRRYALRLRARYAKELSGVNADRLDEIVRLGLAQCPSLRIRRSIDVLRFLALTFLLTAEQQRSKYLLAVMQRVLEAVDDWTPGKRLDFIYRHVVGRPAPDPEPDFGPWNLPTLSPPTLAPER